MPSYVVTAPDGSKHRVTGPGTAEEALAHFQSQYHTVDSFRTGELPPLPGSAEETAQNAKSKPFSAGAEGVLDEAKRVASSVAGPAAKGLAALGENLVSGATGAFSSVKNLANAATGATQIFKNPGESDADFYRRSRLETTYEPRSEGGKELAEGLAKGPMQALNVAPGVKALTGSDTAAELSNDVVNAGLTAAGARGAAPKPGATPLPKKLGPMAENPTIVARMFGDKVRTSDYVRAEGDKSANVMQAAEGFAGSGQLRKSLVAHNAKNGTAKALQDIGVSGSEPRVTQKLLDSASAEPLAKYRQAGREAGDFQAAQPEFQTELEGIANREGLHPDTRADITKLVNEYSGRTMSGPDTVKSISTLRREAARAGRSDDVSTQNFGYAQRQVAEALEAQLGRQLEANGKGETFQAFQAARQKLAKVHDVDTATKGGQIDRHVLLRLKNAGAPLSGNLAILADSADMFPHVTKHPMVGADVGGSGAIPGLGAVLDIGSGLTRPAIRKFLSSDFYQNQLGKPAESLQAQLGEYFPKPKELPPAPPAPEPPPELPKSSASSMLEAQKRAGDLSLADEVFNPQQLPPAPDRLTADVPPASRGGLPFKASAPSGIDLAGELGLTPEVPAGGIPGGHSPRAPGMARDLQLVEDARVNAGPLNRVGGNRLLDQGLDISAEDSRGPFAYTRGGVDFQGPSALGQYFTPDQMREAGRYRTNDYTLAEEGVPFPPSLGREPPSIPPAPAGGPASGAGLDLAKDLGIEITPSTKRQGQFEVRGPNETSGVAFKDERSARKAALSLADELVGGAVEPEYRAPPRRRKTDQGNGMLPANAFDDLFAGQNRLENNASGESSASVEAINRNAAEKAAGQTRYLIEPNGTVIPLHGVGAVDAAARKGQVIIQKGIGDTPYTILDRGGLSKRAAENRIAMVEQLLSKGE